MEALNFTKESKFGKVSDNFGIDSLKCKGHEADIRLTVITSTIYMSACPHKDRNTLFSRVLKCKGNEAG